MRADKCRECDVVIVGSGVAGALIAKQLARKHKKVIILEAGRKVPPNINGYMNRFFRTNAKVPESPYPPELSADPGRVNAGRPTSLMLGSKPEDSYLIQTGPLKFGSTYERIGGGTALHWLGTSLRFVPNDFKMQSTYKRSDDWPAGLVDWPIDYGMLNHWYGEAEAELGVSADADKQAFLGINFPAGYSYQMPGIPLSRVDQAVNDALARVSPADIAFLGLDDPNKRLEVVSTPAARNSLPYQNRRVCAGNTNCIPICPIQAKYDPSVTLNDAFDTGNVELLDRTVANDIVIGENGRVIRIDYIRYQDDIGPRTEVGCISAKAYVIAGNAIETPRLLLMSKNGGRTPRGVANSSDLVGRHLMDHPYYVAWAQTNEPVYPYRGPLSTGGVENFVRDGSFRRERGAFRIEIGNEGWNFVVGGIGGDPDLTTVDFVNGRNNSGLNPDGTTLFGDKLVEKLEHVITRQIRIGFLIEQTPDHDNRLTLSDKYTDGLGLPRPQISYDLSDYSKRGIAAAKTTADLIFTKMNAKPFTTEPKPDDPMSFEWIIDGQKTRIGFMGAGHLMGTYRMGDNPKTSVVNSDQRSWDHRNLFLVGSGVFPTTATANPTLTLAALALRTAKTLLEKDLA